MNLAFKDIRHNRGRFALTAVGIGMLLMVVMGMGGIFRGIENDAVQLVDDVQADLWVVQKETRGPFAELSRLPQNMADRLSAVPGVAATRSFVFHTIQREFKGRPLRLSVLGLSWPDDRGEWLPLTAGRPLRQGHLEMIADASLGLGLGERLRLGKEIYSVVGLTRNMISAAGDGVGFFTVADAQAIQFDYSGEAIRLERAARQASGATSEVGTKIPLLLENLVRPSQEIPILPPPTISAVLVNVKQPGEMQKVVDIISRWDDVSVYSNEAEKNLLLMGTVEKVRKQIGLFRILLTIIAGIIMGLILYTLTLEKIHSIALLKLIGAQNSVIIGLILHQALLLGLIGYGFAWVVGRQIFPLFPRRVLLTRFDLTQLAVIVVIISVVSSMIGIRKALRVSPNEALA